MESKPGVGQVTPEVWPLFCFGWSQALDRLKEELPHVETISCQDDTYILVEPNELDKVFALVRRLWHDFGLAVNDGRLTVLAGSDEALLDIPPAQRKYLVSSLRM